MTTKQREEQDRLNREMEAAFAAFPEDDDSPIFDPPEGEPLSDARDHVSATFLTAPTKPPTKK
jgi:hypothetical protein